MVSELDMEFFVQSVVMEEENLDEESNNRYSQSLRQSKIFGPRQALLNNVPFLVPFETRVNVFRQYVNLDRQKTDYHEGLSFIHPGAKITVRRKHVFEDGYASMFALRMLN